MGLFRKSNSTYWWYRFQAGGVEHKGSTGTRDRRRAAAVERARRSAAEAKAPRRRVGTTTLADLGAIDVRRAAADGATKEHQKTLKYQWRQLCRLLGADTQPQAITLDAVRSYLAKRREEGFTGDTISREITDLWRMLDYAHEHGWLAEMPGKRPKVRRGPGGMKRKGKFHPPAVIRAWLSALPPEARAQAALAAMTSLRAGELRRLTAQWVEPAPDGAGVPAVLHVPAACAKDREDRSLPLVPLAVAIIHDAAERAAADGAAPGLPLFPGDHKRAFSTARRAIGYAQTISLRDLRHTWSTLASRSSGVEASRDMLGHASIATTNRYLTAGLDRTAEAALAIEAQVGEVEPADDALEHIRREVGRILG